MPKRLAWGWAAFGLLLLALAGCTTPTFVGGKQRPKIYQSVVSLTPSGTELVAQLQATNVLKGISSDSNFPPYAASNKKIAALEGKPNWTVLDELKPNLVLYDPKKTTEADIAKMKGYGAETVAIQPKNLEEYVDLVYHLGMLLGKEQVASDYVEKLRGQSALAAGAKLSPPPRAMVLRLDKQGGLAAAGTSSFVAEIVKAAEGVPVGPNGSEMSPITSAEMIRLDPDVIFVAGSQGSAEAVLANPALASLPAIAASRAAIAAGKRETNVWRLDPDVILRTGSRVPAAIQAINTGFHNLAAPPRSDS